MLKNYLTVAIRNLLRHKLYSFINLVGLALGIGCCLLILLYVQYELSYDRFHDQANRIYRVVRENIDGEGNSSFLTGSSGALASLLINEFPEVKQVVRMKNPPLKTWVGYKDKGFLQSFCLAESSILKVFNFPLVKGNPGTALQAPSSVLITEEMAWKYFGEEDPIGKVIRAENWFIGAYIVTGVLKDLPENSTIKFDFLTSDLKDFGAWNTWRIRTGWLPLTTYLMLNRGPDPDDLERKLPNLVARYTGQETQGRIRHDLQPLTRIHLYSNADYGLAGYGDIEKIYLFSILAIFILLLACINFVNLATAFSVGRAKEIGVRKVAGANRLQLIKQLLGESVLIVSLAVFLALVIVELFLPGLSSFTEMELSLIGSNALYLVSILLLLILFVGLLAGSYPAIFLSAFQPVSVLKGNMRTGPRNQRLRKGLVIFQFMISALMTIGTVVVYQQWKYMTHKKLGYNSEQVVVLPIFIADRSLIGKYPVIMDEFMTHPNVLKCTATNDTPVGGEGGGIWPVRPEDKTNDWHMHMLDLDHGVLDVYGFELMGGSNLPRETSTNYRKVFILNEEAVRQLGWKDPIGKQFEWLALGQKGTVLGVVKDFHFQSLHEPIKPLFMTLHGHKQFLVLRISAENLPTTMAFLEKTWKQFAPNRPFEFSFLDEDLEHIYRSDMKFGQLYGSFALLMILVACLGLFGLATLATEQRTKEIGIRKTLGASVAHIATILSMDFVKLVTIANLIAWPVAYFALKWWLQNFAYRINLESWVFLLCGVLNLAIALATVGGKAIKAARANPVDVLRYE